MASPVSDSGRIPASLDYRSGLQRNSSIPLARRVSRIARPGTETRGQDAPHRSRFFRISVADCLCFGFWCVVGLAVVLQCVLMFAVYFHDDGIFTRQLNSTTRASNFDSNRKPPAWFPVALMSSSVSPSSRIAEIISCTTSAPPLRAAHQIVIEQEQNSTTVSTNTTLKNSKGPLSSAVLQTFKSIDRWVDRWTSTDIQIATETNESSNVHKREREVDSNSLGYPETELLGQRDLIRQAVTSLSADCDPFCSDSVQIPREVFPDGLLQPASLRLFVDGQHLFVSRINWISEASGHPPLEIVSGDSVLVPLINRALLASLNRFSEGLSMRLPPEPDQKEGKSNSRPKILSRSFTAVVNRLWSIQSHLRLDLNIFRKRVSDDDYVLNRVNEPSCKSENHLFSDRPTEIEKKPWNKTKSSSDPPHWKRVAAEHLPGVGDWVVGHTFTGEIAVAYRYQIGENEEWRIKLIIRHDRCFGDSDRFIPLDFRLPGSARVSELTVSDAGLIYSR